MTDTDDSETTAARKLSIQRSTCLSEENLRYLKHQMTNAYSWNNLILDVIKRDGVDVTKPVLGVCTFDGSQLGKQTLNDIECIIESHRKQVLCDTCELVEYKRQVASCYNLAVTPHFFAIPKSTVENKLTPPEIEYYLDEANLVMTNEVPGFSRRKSALSGPYKVKGTLKPLAVTRFVRKTAQA